MAKQEGSLHCDNCFYSYQGVSFSNKPIGQHCSNADYNSEDYTSKMLNEDWGKHHCRFYKERKSSIEKFKEEK